MKLSVESLSLENEEFETKVAKLEQEHEELISTNKELAHQLVENNSEAHKMVGGFQKLSNKLLMQKSPFANSD